MLEAEQPPVRAPRAFGVRESSDQQTHPSATLQRSIGRVKPLKSIQNRHVERPVEQSRHGNQANFQGHPPPTNVTARSHRMAGAPAWQPLGSATRDALVQRERHREKQSLQLLRTRHRGNNLGKYKLQPTKDAALCHAKPSLAMSVVSLETAVPKKATCPGLVSGATLQLLVPFSDHLAPDHQLAQQSS